MWHKAYFDISNHRHDSRVCRTDGQTFDRIRPIYLAMATMQSHRDRQPPHCPLSITRRSNPWTGEVFLNGGRAPSAIYIVIVHHIVSFHADGPNASGADTDR